MSTVKFFQKFQKLLNYVKIISKKLITFWHLVWYTTQPTFIKKIHKLFTKIFDCIPRLHSSRMRTARLLPVSTSMHCVRRGGSAPGGGRGVPASGLGGKGVLASGPEGSIPGGVCSQRGCLPLVRRVPASGPGGLLLGGGSAPRGVPASGPGDACLWSRGACLWSWGGPASGPGGYPSIQWGRPPPVNRMIDREV